MQPNHDPRSELSASSNLRLGTPKNGAAAASASLASSPQTLPAVGLVTTDKTTASSQSHHDIAKRGGGVSPELQRQLARPWTNLAPEEMGKVLRELSRGASLRQAAASVGRNHSVLVRQIERNEYFAALVEQYQQFAMLDALGRIGKASQENWRAAAWLIECLERREERQTRSVTKVKAAIAIETETVPAASS